MRFRLVTYVVAGATAASALLNAEPEGKVLAVYAPKPEYPVLPNGERPEGSGIYVIHINPKTGLVRSVSIEKSTGHKVLDDAVINSLKRWKFIKGTPVVKVPFTFTATGQFY